MCILAFHTDFYYKFQIGHTEQAVFSLAPDATIKLFSHKDQLIPPIKSWPVILSPILL